METTAQIITFLACLMAASVPVRGTVDYVKVQNVSGVDFAPGQLKLPLTVQERSGVERKGAVVTSGVPFPPGFLADAGKLAVVDKDGKSVMSQASVMIKWHKPAYDDSVRWALVSFAADVSAGGTATYYLVDNGKTGVETPAVLKLNKTDKEIAIDTGGADQARFVIPLAGQALLAKASLGGIELLGRTTGLRGIVVTGAWDEKKLKAGDKEITTHDAAGVIVEEAGPARLVIAIKGTFLSGDVDKKFYGYLARLYFTAGSPEVRIAFTLTNGRPGCIWPITGASLTADLPFAGKANASVLADAKPVTEVVGDDPIIAFQSTLDIYKLSVGPKELACGARAQGVIDVSDAKMGITATRHRPGSCAWVFSPPKRTACFTLPAASRRPGTSTCRCTGPMPPTLRRASPGRMRCCCFARTPTGWCRWPG